MNWKKNWWIKRYKIDTEEVEVQYGHTESVFDKCICAVLPEAYKNRLMLSNGLDVGTTAELVPLEAFEHFMEEWVIPRLEDEMRS